MRKAITVYGMTLSPPVRLVLMACEVMEIQYELKDVNIGSGEHKSQEYLKVKLLLKLS